MQSAIEVPTYKDSDDLIRQIGIDPSTTQREKKLVKFYAYARFKPDLDDFNRQYVGGGDDGGIDYYHTEDSTYYIFQSKFSNPSQKQDEEEVLHEMDKILNTIGGQNPNRRADDFVDALRGNLANPKAALSIIWLTTNVVPEEVRQSVTAYLEKARASRGWALALRTLFIDKHTLDGVTYDYAHGYIPYTGERRLTIQKANGEYQFIENDGVETGIYSIICTIKLDEVLQWFRDSDAIEDFLQKNIRGWEGNSLVNKGIQTSYAALPEWFWYKHNGIIIFADSLRVDRTDWSIVMRNPQVVNGGQTLRAAFREFSKRRKEPGSARVILRAYQLPYEDTETYRKSVDIIGALNSQNRILASDLHTSDPQQVRLEALFKTLGYTYLRKRSKAPKGRGRRPITEVPMRNLALLYYICKKRLPHEGTRGEVEELFRDPSKYAETFPEADVFEDPSKSHIILKFVTVWRLNHAVNAIRKDLVDRDWLPSAFTRYFVLTSVYNTVWEWKRATFRVKGWLSWRDFIEDDRLGTSVRGYLKRLYRTAASVLPAESSKDLRERKVKPTRQFYQSKEATERFSRLVRESELKRILNDVYAEFSEEM